MRGSRFDLYRDYEPDEPEGPTRLDDPLLVSRECWCSAEPAPHQGGEGRCPGASTWLCVRCGESCATYLEDGARTSECCGDGVRENTAREAAAKSGERA